MNKLLVRGVCLCVLVASLAVRVQANQDLSLIHI